MKEPTSPTVPPKSTLRPTSHILQRNKIDPSDEDAEEEGIIIEQQQKENHKSNKSATLSAKRLSLRIPNAFRNDSTINSSTKKFGFTLGSNSRKQRKQLDLSLFQTEQPQKQEKISMTTSSKKTLVNDSSLLPPPALSDGSTLSSSSSTCSSTHSSYYQASTSPVQKLPPNFKSVINKQSNSNVFAAGNPRRSSQVSFKSMDRRGSNLSTSTLAQQQQQQQQQQSNNNRPTTPSLLSNSSTIASPNNNNNNSIPSQPAKASWLNNLFFFKQPKVCSLVVYSTHTAGILRSLHRLMNKVK